MENGIILQKKILDAKLAVVNAISAEAERERAINSETLVALSETLKSLFEVQPSNVF